MNLGQRGYYVLDITADRAQADYFLLDGIEVDEGAQEHAISFAVPTGVSHASETTGPLPEEDAPTLAPDPPPRPL